VSASKPTILLVEDEPAQRAVLAYNLKSEGFEVIEAEDGEEALVMAQESVPDLVLLDWMLPHVSGLEVCRRLKSGKATRALPVIMLSARSEELDKVRGLETGADDYMVKPYSVAELMARVRKELRRTRPASVGEELVFDDIVLDAGSHRVSRAQNEIKLGPTEFRLLAAFLENQGRDIYVDTRTVDVHIGRLRKALMQHGGVDPLRTVRGAGYALG